MTAKVTLSSQIGLQNVGGPKGSNHPAVGRPADGSSFAQALQDSLSNQPNLRLSAHAQQRLLTRNIQISPENLDRIEQGVRKAGQKGAKESLILMDDLALLVNIRNKLVITAVDRAHAKDNVFTNIDSAVIV